MAVRAIGEQSAAVQGQSDRQATVVACCAAPEAPRMVVSARLETDFNVTVVSGVAVQTSVSSAVASATSQPKKRSPSVNPPSTIRRCFRSSMRKARMAPPRSTATPARAVTMRAFTVADMEKILAKVS